MSKNFVTGLFKTRAAAEAAVDAIIKRGYTRDDISVLMSDSTRDKEFAVQTRSHAADGLGIGGAIGGTVGAVLLAIVVFFNVSVPPMALKRPPPRPSPVPPLGLPPAPPSAAFWVMAQLSRTRVAAL